MSLKLFFSPGACSLVSHIALEEAGVEYEALKLDLAAGDQNRPDYLAINPHARVPALVTDEGAISENIAILNYLADRFGAAGSVPRGDAYAAAHCNQMLGWLASSVHIAFAQIFRPSRFAADSVADAVKQGGRDAALAYFAEIDSLCGDGWIAGSGFTAADSYVATFFRWGRRLGFDMTAFPNAAALAQRVLERPAVQKTLQAEGIDPADFAIA